MCQKCIGEYLHRALVCVFGYTEDMRDLCIINIHACAGVRVCLYMERYIYMQVYIRGDEGGAKIAQ